MHDCKPRVEGSTSHQDRKIFEHFILSVPSNEEYGEVQSFSPDIQHGCESLVTSFFLASTYDNGYYWIASPLTLMQHGFELLVTSFFLPSACES